ncbi:low temperature requirement protein A [Roseomonas sp. OT10]|uniref:low temperature requirement protein A n=1 Tax=Roseomonas cutis TaxID=2897332 RepID=UPI001E5313EE|nr:low temperature requirement protein A [Roseomonas sp. OT10]UFN50871.1 low temperature requirement protein A [Roseomonas sp. OT10]
MRSSGAAVTQPPLRHRDGHHARVTFEELFFDLVYVFAVTQVSHGLLHHLTGVGAVEALILWFAVWLGWQYTCWATNWFDPETPAIRGLLFATMLAGLLMAAALPQAFGERGLLFALAYAAMQVGRTAFLVWQLGPGHPLSANYRRMLGWVSIAALFWIAGGLAPAPWRHLPWIVAVLCEYVSPMFGFALPGMGRSETRDWTIEGGHLAERCQLFVIVALGETVLVTGATLSAEAQWDAPGLIAFLTTFLGSLAMWWVYFGTSSKDGSAAITRSADPGRMGAYFHYVHAILIAGIIVTAVGNDLVIAHPDGHMTVAAAATLIGGPALYLLGGALYKRVVYGAWPASHLAGIAALAALLPFAFATDLLMIGGLTTLVMLGVALWETRRARRGTPAPAH